jgi:hypothetical protein
MFKNQFLLNAIFYFMFSSSNIRKQKDILIAASVFERTILPMAQRKALLHVNCSTHSYVSI